MAQYTEQKSVNLSEEQWNEMKEAVESGEYSFDTEYLRAMIEAGKSNVAALDPRTSDTESQSDVTHKNPSEAARALSDEVLIDSLKGDKQGISEVLTEASNEFQSQLAHRLAELADDDTSPVKMKRTPEENYWLEGDEK